MLLTSTILKSLKKRTIGAERHWSHGTRQKPKTFFLAHAFIF